MTRAALAFALLLAAARSGCVAPESHVREELDGGPADSGATEPTPADAGATDPAPADAGPPVVGPPRPTSCAEQCEACAATFGTTVERCVDACERRRAVALDNGCEDRFLLWSGCVADACDEVDRCNEEWRSPAGSCF